MTDDPGSRNLSAGASGESAVARQGDLVGTHLVDDRAAKPARIDGRGHVLVEASDVANPSVGAKSPASDSLPPVDETGKRKPGRRTKASQGKTDPSENTPTKRKPQPSTPLDAPVSSLSGVGPGTADKLGRLNVHSIRDLLLHIPSRYQDHTRSVPISELTPGQECLVTGVIVSTTMGYGRRRPAEVTVADHSRELTVRFFNFRPGQLRSFTAGTWIRCFGEIRAGRGGLEMAHPEYRLHGDDPGEPVPALTPVYPLTQGLTSKRLAQWVDKAFERVAQVDFSVLPGEPFPDLLDALRHLHRPQLDDATAPNHATGLEAARARIALDELVCHYLVLKYRQKLVRTLATTPLPSQRQLGRQLLKQLGFRLTRAQARVATEVLNDLSASRPMMRLLQGDVGSGKTVIAAFAAIRAAENGCQTALMAPTEILAEQHYETLSDWLTPLGIGVALLTGRQSAKERQTRLAAVETGQDLVVVGTHALFQAGVEFRALALTIIDEQHRFGVHQRMSLRDKARLPHQLVMTATPIPRTLTMALYADMDISTIDELPPGRQPVRTHLQMMSRRADVIARVAEACAGGRQAYWVCTAIEDDPEADVTDRPPPRAVLPTHEELSKAMGDGIRLGVVHGRLPPAEKSAAMAAFKAGETDVLVATTVIEVGVDVPNATLMVIDNAERLGLAQLHQLRGRIGRGGGSSSCLLLYEGPVSAEARQRLTTMRETNDGFRIAEKDLELRGPGDVLGTRQTGEETFRLADLVRDRALASKAATVGERLRTQDPDMARRVVTTWAREDADYAHV